MITTISNIVNSGGSPAALLPDQISNLACTGGTDGTAGTIDVSFNEVPATSFDLLKYYILIYKAGGIPQTPFDGVRITLPKSKAKAKKTYQITGLTFDQLYGMRIYPVSVRNQFQTLTEGAIATATPVAGIKAIDLLIGNHINMYLDGRKQKHMIVSNNHYGQNDVVLWNFGYYNDGLDIDSITYRNSSLNTKMDSIYNSYDPKFKNLILPTQINLPYNTPETFEAYCFPPSIEELNFDISDLWYDKTIFPGDKKFKYTENEKNSAKWFYLVNGRNLYYTYFFRNSYGKSDGTPVVLTTASYSGGNPTITTSGPGNTNCYTIFCRISGNTILKTEPRADGTYDVL